MQSLAPLVARWTRLTFALSLTAALAAACGGPSGPETGGLTVDVITRGSSPDPDGYAVSVAGRGIHDVGANGSITYSSLPTGPQEVTVTNQASNCSVGGSPSATVVADDTVRARVTVRCEASIQDRIVFVSNRGGDQALYTMNADGSGQRLLRSQSAVPSDVAADGTRVLVVTRPRDYDQREIGVVGADGTFEQLTDNGTAERVPRFEAGDSTIVYLSRPASGDWTLFRMDANGSNNRQITHLRDDIDNPDPAPGGERIAIERYNPDTDSRDLFAINAGDGGLRILQTAPHRLYMPRYSPSGDRIAFASDPGDDYLRVMTADGTGGHVVMKVTDIMPYHHWGPDHEWLPSGNALVFRHHGDIFRINADGTSKINLTAHRAYDERPVPSPWTSGNP